ncbi:MAG TPA: hypothetical protein VMV18_14050 [bacterium]|nr:hypothetical protein [bacterium]
MLVAAVGVVLSSVAAASEPPDREPAASLADRSTPVDGTDAADRANRAVPLPREPRPATPRAGRDAGLPGQLTWTLGSTAFRTAVPVGSTAGTFDGRAGRLGLSWSKDGQRFLWTIDATGSLGTPVADRDNVPASKATALRARGAAMLPLGASFAAGLAAEVSANAIGSIAQGDEYLSSWQTVVAGAQVRARVPLSSRFTFLADGFAGASPVAGRFDAVDTASRHNASGAFAAGGVVSGAAAISLRTGDRFALSAGLAGRGAQIALARGGSLFEHELTPYVTFGRAF